MKRDSFVFYRSFYEAIECMPKKEQLSFYKALCKYALDGEEPKLSGTTRGLFVSMTAAIDANNKRYLDGKKGGRPKKNNQWFSDKKPVVSNKKTSGYETKNPPIYDVDVNVNDNVDVDGEVSSSLTTALSPAEELILYLNEKAYRAFQFTDTNIGLATALLDKYDTETIHDVIDNKVAMWKDDARMAGYLRPRTLFDMNNFEDYLNEPLVEDSP